MNVIVLGPSSDAKEVLGTIYPISEDVVVEALKTISNSSNLPAMIVCKTGKAQSGGKPRSLQMS